MTGRERILAALRGEKPDRVPFAPNLWQWYHANDYNGTLPEEVRSLRSPVEVLRLLGADVLSKFDSPRPLPVYRDCEYTFRFSGGLPKGRPPWSSFGDTFAGGLIRHERIDTPCGALSHTWEYQAETGAPFETAHWWKDFDSEYPVVRHWLERRRNSPLIALMESQDAAA
jgi:hypothetical protein